MSIRERVALISAGSVVLAAIITTAPAVFKKEDINFYQKGKIVEEIKENSKINILEKAEKNDYQNYYNLIDTINLANDLYGMNQYASAYRIYIRLYDSSPNTIREKIKRNDILMAKEKYRVGKYFEAAYLMKKNFIPIKIYLQTKGKGV